MGAADAAFRVESVRDIRLVRHLKFAHRLVVLVSWGIALAEYCVAASANRVGRRAYTMAELKTIQESHPADRVHGFFRLLSKENVTLRQMIRFSLSPAEPFLSSNRLLGETMTPHLLST